MPELPVVQIFSVKVDEVDGPLTRERLHNVRVFVEGVLPDTSLVDCVPNVNMTVFCWRHIAVNPTHPENMKCMTQCYYRRNATLN